MFQENNKSWSFLWTTDEPTLNSTDQRFTHLQRAATERNVRNMVLILSAPIKPFSNILKKLYILFELSSLHMAQTCKLRIWMCLQKQRSSKVIAGKYQWSHKAMVPSAACRRTTSLWYARTFYKATVFTVSTNGLVNLTTLVVQIASNPDTLPSMDSNTKGWYRTLNPHSSVAGMGSLSLLEPCKDKSEPFDTAKCSQYLYITREAEIFPTMDRDTVKLYKFI